MEKETKEIKLSDGQECLITVCGGVQGRKICLEIVDLMKPEQMGVQTPKEVAKNLVLNNNSDSSFVDKADKLLSKILALSYVKINGEFKELNDNIFNVEFAGRYGAMIELLMEIIEHNGFLEALGYLAQSTKMFQV